MTTTAFDPTPGEPYAHADDGTTLDTWDDAEQWLTDNPGKTITVTNPTRIQRVRNVVDGICYEALCAGMGDGFDGVYRLVENGDLTAEEATLAVNAAGFGDTWAEYYRARRGDYK